MLTNQPATGFFGAEVETDLSQLEAEVAILGVPHGWPYPTRGTTAGCADAPDAVRHRSERQARFRDHWDFDLDGPMTLRPMADAGDVPGEAGDGAGNSARTSATVDGPHRHSTAMMSASRSVKKISIAPPQREL